MEIENIIRSKSEKQKAKINQMLETLEIKVDSLTKEDLIDCLSVAKVNLNGDFSLCSSLNSVNFSNISETTIFSKSKKIDDMISFFNNSHTFTSYTFKNNSIEFDTLKKIKKIQLNIENFNYELPLEFIVKIYCSDKTVIEKNIIPFNYSGLFNEFFIPENKAVSLFKTANKNNIIFYSCIYNEKTFQIGTEIVMEKNKDYYVSKDGNIVLNKKFIKHENLLVKYQPTTDSFEIDINKMVSKIEIVVKNDLLKIENQLDKKIEVFLYD